MTGFDLSDCETDAQLLEDLNAETFPSTATAKRRPTVRNTRPYDPEFCARIEGMKRALATVAIFAALRRLLVCAGGGS